MNERPENLLSFDYEGPYFYFSRTYNLSILLWCEYDVRSVGAVCIQGGMAVDGAVLQILGFAPFLGW
jgi:hypothetical protein